MLSTLKFVGRYFIAAIIIFVVMALIEILPNMIEPLAKLQFSFTDYRLIDIYYSTYWESEKKRDDIVLVNIEYLDRDSIALVIDKINQLDPSVIGLNVFFQHKKDSTKDNMLRKALSKSKKLVFPIIISEELNKTSNTFFTNFPQTTIGFGDIWREVGDFGAKDVVTSFLASTIKEKDTINSFAVEVVKRYNPDLLKLSSIEPLKFEFIKYKADTSGFQIVNWRSLMNDKWNRSFKNKIVLIGFLGIRESSYKNLADKFITPLNSNISGDKDPDSYSLTIHANIIAMFIDNDFISSITQIVSIILVIIGFPIYIYLMDKLYQKFNSRWTLRITCYALALIIFFLINILYFSFDFYLHIIGFILVSVILPEFVHIYFYKIVPFILDKIEIIRQK